MKGIDFPLLISGPKEVPITAEQHDKLSYMGLASFMVKYPICFKDDVDFITLFCPDWKANYFHEMPRFSEVIPGRINQSAELGYFIIPKTTKLFKLIDKKFKHLFLK